MEQTLIKCFKTPKRKYFYDRGLDAIIAATDEEYNTLQLIEQTGKIPQDKSLNRLLNGGLLQKATTTEIEHSETQDLKLLSEHYIGNLILQVTQQCNLRCKYCAYSGNYYNRVHSSKRMDFELAKKAIDFYLKRSDKMNELCLSFYGGEPLLEFELIKKCVEYIMKYKGDRSISFPLTTNGTLLNKEIMEFLVKYNFSLLISLDGNKESHDKNRRFKQDKGSFDTVLENIKNLREFNEEFYRKHVMFNCVLSSTTDFEATLEFYSNNKLFSPNMVNFNFVSPVDIKDDQFLKVTLENDRAHKYEYLKMLLSVLNKREMDSKAQILRKEIGDTELLYERLHKHIREGIKTHHGGPCIPGVRRLFIATDGRFYPCERVSESDPEMCIGNIDNGFDYTRMDFYLNHGKMIENECLRCWNLRECSFCLNGIPKGGKNLTADLLRKKCIDSKSKTLDLFLRLCVMVEMGYTGNANLRIIK